MKNDNSMSKIEFDQLTKQAEELCDENTEEGFSKAFEIYERLVEVDPNYNYGWYSLGYSYESGEGVRQDIEKAKECYEISSNNMHSLSIYALARILVNENDKKCIELFEKALELEYWDSARMLADIYMDGELIEKDFDKVQEYFEICCENESYKGIYSYATFISRELNPVKNYASEDYGTDDYDAQLHLKALSLLENVKQNCVNEVVVNLAKKEIEQLNEVIKMYISIAFNHYIGGKDLDVNMKKAEFVMQIANDCGMIEASFLLGRFYFDASGELYDIEKSFEYFSSASQRGHKEAIGYLGLVYYDDNFSHRDVDKATLYLEQACENKVWNVMVSYVEKSVIIKDCNVDKFYEVLDKIPRAKAICKEVLEQNECERSKTQAESLLIDIENLLIEFIRVSSINLMNFDDVEKSLDSLEKCVELGESYAAECLGKFYILDQNPDSDAEKSIKYYEKALELGNTSVLYVLGIIHCVGIGIEKDIDTGLAYLKKGVELNDHSCMLEYATNKFMRYKAEFEDVTSEELSEIGKYFEVVLSKSHDEEIIEKAKERKKMFDDFLNAMHMTAIDELFNLFNKEDRDESNIQRGINYFEILTNYGNMVSPKYLAEYYEKIGDHQKAFYYYKLSSERGFLSANIGLGKLYYFGEGTEKNIYKAEELLSEYVRNPDNESDSSDCIAANLVLTSIYANGDMQDDAKYVKCAEVCARAGMPDYQKQLGLCYGMGEGVEKDYEKALYWLEMALENGYNDEDDSVAQLISLFYEEKRERELNNLNSNYSASNSNYSNPNSSSTKSGGCYVATAVYGSYNCPQVWVLRRFRDNTLDSTWYGKLFIKLYYLISPTILKIFGDNVRFKKFWKQKLDLMVNKLSQRGFESTPYEDKEF